MQPLEVAVARIHTEDGLHLRLEQVSPLQAKAGQTILLKVLFRLDDHGASRDDVDVRFSSRSPQGAPKPTSLHQHDHRGIDDSMWGALTQKHAFPAAGAYEIEFQVDAREDGRPWSASQEQVHQDFQVTGSVAVRVR